MDSSKAKKEADKDRKSVLCSELSAAIKRLQKQRFLLKGTESSESDEAVPEILEAIFLHELKNNKGYLWREIEMPDKYTLPEPSFWSFIEPLVSDEIKMQLDALRSSDSAVKRCRSWVRLVLSKGGMLHFLEDLQRHPGLLAFHYSPEALLRDIECSEVVVQLLKGLTGIEMHCDYTSSRLDSWEVSVLSLSGIWSPPSETTKQSTKSLQRGEDKTTSLGQASGVAVIHLAMDQYRKKVNSMSGRGPGSANLTDSEVIRTEYCDQAVADLTELEPENKSYNSLVRSYMRKYSQSAGRLEEDSDHVLLSAKQGRTESGIANDTAASCPLAQSLEFEIVPASSSVPVDTPFDATNTTLVARLVNERGLDAQNYQCAGCQRPIGVIFGKAKLCKFNGKYFCYDCHQDDERIIPARVVFNWDFRKHRVCKSSCQFLDSMERSPALNIQEMNNSLYGYIDELEQTRKQRVRLKHLKEYLVTCRDNPEVIDQFRKKLFYRSHIFENEHLYSLQDLVELHSGVLTPRLKKAVKLGKKHVLACQRCSQKGYFCETCHSDQVIYPFDTDTTYQCSDCKALYHVNCKPAKGSVCPKCQRIERRKKARAS